MLLHTWALFTSTVTTCCYTLEHCSPRQSRHAVTHLSPLFQQEHRLVLQGLVEDVLHLQRTYFSRSLGAGAMSVMTGDNLQFSTNHPHSNGSMRTTFRLFQIITCRCTLRLCWNAARSVGGSRSGRNTDEFIAAISL